MSLRYCLYVGILCIGIFTLFGNDLGVSVFKDENAGSFIMTLAWLCPFLYLVTTMGSILNGLGKTSTTFIQNVTALFVRLAFVHIFSLKKQVAFSWNAWDMIVKPALLMVMAIGIYYAAGSVCDPFAALPLFIRTSFHILILSLCYLLLLAGAHFFKREIQAD